MRLMSFRSARRRFGTAAAAALLISLCLGHGVRAQTVRQISLATKDLAFDPYTQKIYVSVPSSAGAGGNSIRPIDPFPATPVLGSAVFVGSEPGKLALSDNGQYLYVALDGAGAVRRFNLATQTAGLQFAVGSENFTGTFYAEDMEVVPGSPESVAISRRNRGFSPRHEGVAIYDNGVQRAAETPGHTGSNAIEFSPFPSRLYGYNNETTEYGFRRMQVGPSGVTTQDSTGNLISDFDVDIEYGGGLVFATSGQVIDPEARVLLGTFTGVGASAKVEPVTEVNRVFFLSAGSEPGAYTLRAFEASTFLPLGSTDIAGVSGTPITLIRWGTNGLAFNTTGGQVYLIQTPLIPNLTDPAVDLAVGSDNKTHHLLRYADNSAGIWTVGGAGVREGYVRYGAYAGWAPEAIASGGDGGTRLLWNRDDGAAGLWLLNAANVPEAQVAYGPYPDWSAADVAAADGANTRLLWTHADGTMGLWTVDAAGGISTFATFGPYAGWTARALSVGADGKSRVLWNHADGRAGLWVLSAAHALESFVSDGPYAGWAATELAGAGGTTRLLWNRTDGSTGLWTVNAAGSILDSATINPVAGWTSNALAVGPDGNTRLSWNRSDGTVGWWRLSPSHIADAYLAYPPF